MHKINYKKIAIATPLIIAWIFGGRMLFEGFFNLEQSWKTFIPILGLSAIGVFLYLLKRRPDANPHWIDSMGMMIIGIGPVTASFDLLPKDDFGRMLMPSFTIIVTIIWFLYFGMLIKPTEYQEPKKREQEELWIKQTKRSTWVFFGFLLVLIIALFLDLLNVNRVL